MDLREEPATAGGKGQSRGWGGEVPRVAAKLHVIVIWDGKESFPEGGWTLTPRKGSQQPHLPK